MSKSMRLTALTAVVGLMLSLMALPAAAFDIVMFRGTAEVCADPVIGGGKPASKSPCPVMKKDGTSSGPHGLYLIGQPGGAQGPGGLRLDPLDTNKWTNRNGNYRFSSGGFIPELPAPCLKHNPLADVAPVACQIKVEGKLAPVAGIGAACGISEGHAGEGWIVAANNSKAQVWDVGWPASAGGTLPVKGHYFVKTPKTKVVQGVKPRRGQFFGVVQAQGGDQCVKSEVTGKGGATNFDVVGVVVMTDQDKDPGKEPPEKKRNGFRPKPS